MSTSAFSALRLFFAPLFVAFFSLLCLVCCTPRPAFADTVPLQYTYQAYLGNSSSFSNNKDLMLESIALIDYSAGGSLGGTSHSYGVFPTFQSTPNSAQYFGVGVVSTSPIVNPGETLVAQPMMTALVLTRSGTSITASSYGGTGQPLRYFAQYEPNGSWVSVTPDADGGFTPQSRPLYGFAYTCRLHSNSLSFSDDQIVALVDYPKFYRLTQPDGDVIGAIEQQTDDITSAMEQQTDKLLSTDGSDDILSGGLEGGEDGLLDRLGFVGTVVQVPVSIFEGLTSDEDSTIDFPGVSVPIVGVTFEIPAYSIDLWENFPALETPVRTGCTFVVVLLWLRGCKSIYERIVHGSTMVETE